MACFKILAFLALALFVQGTLGEIICEHLDQGICAYAISSTGKRCVLEKQVKRSGEEAYKCATSEIEADKLRNWVETDECIKACGLNRKSLGISSDSLLESRFTQQLCSPQCYGSCPNIVDLYFNLAAGEGVFLPNLCEATEGNARRGLMADLKSSGFVALAPLDAVKYATVDAPAPAVLDYVDALAPAVLDYVDAPVPAVPAYPTVDAPAPAVPAYPTVDAPAPAPAVMDYVDAPTPAVQAYPTVDEPAPAPAVLDYVDAPAPAVLAYTTVDKPAPAVLDYVDAPAPAVQDYPIVDAPAPMNMVIFPPADAPGNAK